jgi:tRNA-modifying protein YgfZ
VANSGFFVDVSDRAIVSLRGPESLDLIHRISTNDVLNVPLNGSVQTVFTNEKGRIVDVASILNRGEEGLLVVGQAADPTMLKDWIEKFVIMEEIETGIPSGDLLHFMLYGLIDNLGKKHLSFVDSRATIFHEMLGSSSLTHVVTHGQFRDVVEVGLAEAGFERRDYQEYDEYRILRGIPGFPQELSTSFNPLEAGLGSLVSFTKGCYVGQEVIARLDTYKKVQKHLVRLALDDLPQRLPDAIFRKGQEWGIVTSARAVKSHGYRGIGFVKSGYDELLDDLCFRRGTEEIKIEIESGAIR